MKLYDLLKIGNKLNIIGQFSELYGIPAPNENEKLDTMTIKGIYSWIGFFLFVIFGVYLLISRKIEKTPKRKKVEMFWFIAIIILGILVPNVWLRMV